MRRHQVSFRPPPVERSCGRRRRSSIRRSRCCDDGMPGNLLEMSRSRLVASDVTFLKLWSEIQSQSLKNAMGRRHRHRVNYDVVSKQIHEWCKRVNRCPEYYITRECKQREICPKEHKTMSPYERRVRGLKPLPPMRRTIPKDTGTKSE